MPKDLFALYALLGKMVKVAKMVKSALAFNLKREEQGWGSWVEVDFHLQVCHVTFRHCITNTGNIRFIIVINKFTITVIDTYSVIGTFFVYCVSSNNFQISVSYS